MTDSAPERKSREIPIVWEIPAGILTRHVTHFAVQNTGHELLVSFFEVHPPYIIGSPETQQQQLENVEVVQAECVGRVVVAPARVQELVELLQGALATAQVRPTEGE